MIDYLLFMTASFIVFVICFFGTFIAFQETYGTRGALAMFSVAIIVAILLEIFAL